MLTAPPLSVLPPPLSPPLLPWGKRSSGDSPPLPRFGRWHVNFYFSFFLFFGMYKHKQESLFWTFAINTPPWNRPPKIPTSKANTTTYNTHTHTYPTTKPAEGHHTPTIHPAQPPHIAHAPPHHHRRGDESYPLHHKLKVTPLIIHHFFPTRGLAGRGY